VSHLTLRRGTAVMRASPPRLCERPCHHSLICERHSSRAISLPSNLHRNRERLLPESVPSMVLDRIHLQADDNSRSNRRKKLTRWTVCNHLQLVLKGECSSDSTMEPVQLDPAHGDRRNGVEVLQNRANLVFWLASSASFALALCR
jgi:hypothetical protein